MPVNPIELTGPLLIVATAAARVTAVITKRPLVRAAVGFAAAGGILVPVGKITSAGFLLSVIAPSSAASILLLTMLFVGIVGGFDARPQPSRPLLLIIMGLGIPFFFLTAGFSVFDPYDLGYQGSLLLVMMLPIVIVGWVFRAIDAQVWICLSLLAWLCQAYDSANLWDYWLDPVAVIMAACYFLADVIRSGKRTRSLNDVNGSTVREHIT